MRFIKANKEPFVRRAFQPYFTNPGGWNIDALITLVGLGVWVVITIGSAFGYCQPVPEVQQIGSMLFGLGIGRASKSPGTGE